MSYIFFRDCYFGMDIDDKETKVNMICIGRKKYAQHRLRYYFKQCLLEYFDINELRVLCFKLKEKFRERRDLDKGYMNEGRYGKDREKFFCWEYIDDMIIDNGLWGRNKKNPMDIFKYIMEWLGLPFYMKSFHPIVNA